MSTPKNLNSNQRYGKSSSISPEQKTTGINRTNRSGGFKSPNVKKIQIKPPITPVQLFIKDLLSEFLKQAVEIGEFHTVHKKNQKQYENRYVQKELIFISPSDEFRGKVKQSANPDFFFLSKTLNKYLMIEAQGLLTMTSFTTNQSESISLNNFYEKHSLIISCELYETASECFLLSLYENFNFCSVDLLEINFTNPISSLYDAKKNYFNFKCYLNIPNTYLYQPMNNLKILSLPQSIERGNQTVILNFTQIANRIILFNFKSFAITNNLFISPEIYSQIEANYIEEMSIFIKLFFSKKWSVSQAENVISLIDTITSSKSVLFNSLKQLAYLLSIPSEDLDNISNLSYSFLSIKSKNDIKKKSNTLYNNIISPLVAIAINPLSKCGMFNIFNLLTKIKQLFIKLKSTSRAVSQNNLLLIESSFGIYEKLFIQCFQRGIDLQQIFIDNDKDKKGYLNLNLYIAIMRNLPIGLTDNDIQDLIAFNYIFDDCNNIMFNYLFFLEEERVSRLIYALNQTTIGSRFQCGFFNISHHEDDIVKRSDCVRRRFSYDFEYEDSLLSNKQTNVCRCDNDYDGLVQYLLNSSFSSEISHMLYFPHFNLFLVLSPNSQNISILQSNFDPTQINQNLVKIGVINLNTYSPPNFIEYLPERNVVITQRIHPNKQSADLVMIHLYKDILVKTKENVKQLSIDLCQRRNIINKVVIDEPIMSFKYLYKTDLFLIVSSSEIILLNPKSKLFELSFQIKSSEDISTSNRSMFVKTCKNICEYPSEKTGDLPYKIEKRMLLPFDSLLKVQMFCTPNQSSSTDWIIFFSSSSQNASSRIASFSINQIKVSIKSKEIDNPIPNQDIENLYQICKSHMKKDINNYLQKSSNHYFNQNKQEKEINNKVIFILSQMIKDTKLHNKNLIIHKASLENIQTIHDMIHMIKELNLNYEPCKLNEMVPILQFINSKYNEQDDYFQTVLFTEQVRDTHTTQTQAGNIIIDELNLPKNSLKNNNDLATIANSQTLLDSAIKKFAKYSLKQGIALTNGFFKKIDLHDEEILSLEQFTSGLNSFGMFKDNYITIGEIKEIFSKMDANNAKCVTKDEFNRFFEKNDHETIISKIKQEKLDRLDDPFLSYDTEQFALNQKLREELVSNTLNEIIASNIELEKQIVNDENVQKTMVKLTLNIKKGDIEALFPNGIIFLNGLIKMAKLFDCKLEQSDIQILFNSFDRFNKNKFIQVKDIINYFSESSSKPTTLTIDYKISEKEFVYVIISIMKKFIKYCLFYLEIPIEDFTEQFLLSKKVNKTTVILEYLPTKILLERIESKIRLSLYETYILFKCYADIFNFGILFKNELISRFDCLMKIIYDKQCFNYDEFEISTDKGNDVYVNMNKIKLANQTSYFQKESIKKKITVFDKTVLLFLSLTQQVAVNFEANPKQLYLAEENSNLSYLSDMNNLKRFMTCFDKNKDSFLSLEEFNEILKLIFGQSLYNKTLANFFMNNFVKYIAFINEPPKSFISINHFILFLVYTIKHIEYLQPKIGNQYILSCSFDKIFEQFHQCLCSFFMFNSLGTDIESYSTDYLKLTREGIFSGMIILNKIMTTSDTITLVSNKRRKINDYKQMYMNLSNDILISSFSSKIKSNEIILEKFSEPNYTEIEIPIVRVNIIDTREMINRRVLSCGYIENFDYYHQELQAIVNITKFRKAALLTEISSDGSNLLNHIEYSLKVNHYLQRQFFNRDDKIAFPFIRNFGIYIKEVIIDKVSEEEIYIINEKINGEFISLHELIKSNGGLLQIPELANTDMAFYILRFWGKQLLHILVKFIKINVCCKYFTLKDFYLSNDGKYIKMKNLIYYSFVDMNGKLMGGPDIYKIFLLLDQVSISDSDHLPDEKIIDVYDNAYLAPEFLIGSPRCYTNKIDTWSFGVCLFNILYGFLPHSFYHQLKFWCDHSTNLIFEKILHNLPYDIIGKHFFFNPFENINEITEDEYYFTKVLKMKSFSAIVKEKYLNLSTENTSSINGLGIILDMVNTCLAVDATKRPDLLVLLNCDLFAFDQYEIILCNKFLDNVLNYYSPEIIIEKNILLPLRSICSEVLKNEKSNPLEVNQYENFIFDVIRKINTYLFSREFIEIQSDVGVNLEEEKKDNGKNMFVKNPEYYFKNSMIIKSIIDNKVFDILIFLVLRHFTNNLSVFKVNFCNSFKTQMKVASKHLNDPQKIKLSSLKNSDYKIELKRVCGRLMIAMTDLLTNCVAAMSSYDHMLTLYVENIIVFILKLFIGEENQLLGDIVDKKSEGDEVAKYVLLRTFLRDDKMVSKTSFEEDEADVVFSVENSNKDLVEVTSNWSPELYQFTIDLFKDAFGENGKGNYRHTVIKNYFNTINEYEKNLSNQMENPFVNQMISTYITIVDTQQVKLDYHFLNSEYINEILALCDCCVNILSTTGLLDNDPHKNLVNKKNALSYIYTVFKNKNKNKIRACLDTKIHYYILSFLYTNRTDAVIITEVINILKEISLSLIDMNEIGWIFGNNYSRIFDNAYKRKSDMNDLEELNDRASWDSNFSLIDFMNKILNKSHSFILHFTDKFLGLNLRKKSYSVNLLLNEIGLIFSSPLCLKPLMHILQKPNENIISRQRSLDILFNLMLSNNKKIISTLNLTLCNFYEIIVSLIHGSLTLPAHLRPDTEEPNDALSKAKDCFKTTLRQLVNIIIELQNPFIKTQMFSSSSMVKYMEQNNLQYVPRLEIEEIENEFFKLSTILNFTNHEDKIVFLINAFKCWIFHLESDKLSEYLQPIHVVINSIGHIFNNEWSEGLKQGNKNCVVFNIVKLFEWLIKKDFVELLFPKTNESEAMLMLLSLLTKVRENSINMYGVIEKINTMNVSKTGQAKLSTSYSMNKRAEVTPPNSLGTRQYTLQKIYNFISIKMLNIISLIFGLKDDYYNRIFTSANFGSIFAELLKIQYGTLSAFLNQENIDISILDNYMHENRLRIDIFQNILNLNSKLDEIKYQFLHSEFVNFIFKQLIYDFRRFKTDYKKLSLQFLPFKESYPLRTEAISLINIIIRKYNNINARTQLDSFIYDELIRNVKISHLIQNELATIKNKIKGLEVTSVLSLFNIILCHKDKEMMKIMNQENSKDYFLYAIQKDTSLKKIYPAIVDYINQNKIETEV